MAALLGNKPKDSVNKPISFDVKLNGKSITSDFLIIKINVDKAINKLSRARVYISAGDAYQNEFKEGEDADFEPGKSVEISLGYEQDNDVVFKGIVEKMGISLKNGFASKPWQSLLVLECVDKAVKLTNTYTSDVYEKKKDSDLFSILLKKVVGLKSVVSATSVTHPFLPKYNSSDWEFIIERARLNGFVVINSDNEINISKPSKTVISPELVITNGQSTINFDAQIDSGSQISGVTLESFDPFTEKMNKSKSSEPSLIANKILSGVKISKLTSDSAITISAAENLAVTELKTLSDSILQSSRLNRIIGNAKFKGVSNIDLGSVVSLNGFGKKFDGNIYVTKLSHQVESGFFTTQVGFGIKSDHFKRTNSIDNSSFIDPINGIHIGTVMKIDADPLNQGRIQVLIPSLKNSGKGIWAKLSHFYTAQKAGSFFIPEVKTQVIISFIANDPRQPVILGCLYTKASTPYIKVKKDNSLKAFLTKSKLTIEFDDKDKKITISSPKKNSIVIDEKAKGIIITDQNKNVIKTSASGIDLTSKKDVKITASGVVSITGTKGVSVNGKSGSGLKLQGNKVGITAKVGLTANGGSKASLEAKGKVTIKGASVGIN